MTEHDLALWVMGKFILGLFAFATVTAIVIDQIKYYRGSKK